MTDRRRMNRAGAWGVLASLVLLGLVVKVAAFSPQRSGLEPFAMPAFTQESAEAWLNSPPLEKSDLAGKVVLIDFWTFECWNCYRSFPWLNALESRFADRDLVVIGIHTPEFDHEKDPARVARKIEEFGLHHAVMLDNDFAFWRAMNNYAWPAFYLVDRTGVVRQRFVGETHEGDARARTIEAAIESLLAESAAGS